VAPFRIRWLEDQPVSARRNGLTVTLARRARSKHQKATCILIDVRPSDAMT
jgi:hypothetical protein